MQIGQTHGLQAITGIWLTHVHTSISLSYKDIQCIYRKYIAFSQNIFHVLQQTWTEHWTFTVTVITWFTINLVPLAFVFAKFHHSDAGVCWLGFPQLLPFYQPSQHIIKQSIHTLSRGGRSLIVSRNAEQSVKERF